MNDTVPLLFEIGCEEIPARFLAQSQIALGRSLQVLLEESRLLPEPPEGVQTFSTPRRLVAYAPALLVHQP
ncbi:MAG TPA: glycine--tRNA ligase subunit beta, partial [Terriglobia bacterium]|nr:glycine--tRNA ligase subunit beta [Terriglobia bacterium]